MAASVPRPTSGAPLKFVCSTCWLVFDNGGTRACADCGTASPLRGWPTLPFQFRERYLFVEQLGRGGQGAVFRAYDRQAAEPWVAVKVARLHGESRDKTFLKEMFRREGRAHATLAEYPQYFVGFRGSDFNDPAYLVMDFVPWPTLKQLHANEGNLHPLAAARLGVEILRGVRLMERRKIVHRDLKPENIFADRSMDDSFQVKIADLGVWIEIGAADESLLGRSQEYGHVGTVAYMSPEQMRRDALTTASDVHAVGSVLWKLLTGAVPFPTIQTTDVDQRVRERLTRCGIQPPRPPSMPEELYRILSIALRTDPSERAFPDPQTMVGSDNPSNGSIPRGMEKALQRFIDEYAERRARALRAAFEKIQLLETQLHKGERKIASAQLLSTKAQEIRNRLDRLNGQSTGFEAVLDALGTIEGEIRIWDASVDELAYAGRAEIAEATERAEEAESKLRVEKRERAQTDERLRAEEGKRVAAEQRLKAEEGQRQAAEQRLKEEEEARTAADGRLAAERAEAAQRFEDQGRQLVEAQERLKANDGAGGKVASETAEKAGGDPPSVRKQLPIRWLLAACFALMGSCAGVGLSSTRLFSQPSIPVPSKVEVSTQSTVPDSFSSSVQVAASEGLVPSALPSPVDSVQPSATSTSGAGVPIGSSTSQAASKGQSDPPAPSKRPPAVTPPIPKSTAIPNDSSRPAKPLGKRKKNEGN